MGKITYFIATNSAATATLPVSITELTPTEITYTSGILRSVYQGRFAITNGQLTGGTVTGISSYQGSTLVSQVTGISDDLAALQVALSTLNAPYYYSVLLGSNAVIQGSSGNDVLTGGGGTTFISGGGNDAITGSGGGTTLVVPYGYRQVSVPTATGGALVTPGGTDTITGIQTISLADGRVSYDASGHAEQVTLLYQAALGRAPDQSGLSFWTTALDQGASLKALGTAFLNAPEFAARTPGASGPDNSAFVEQLYQNVLHRGSDAAGKASWVGRLNSGALTRADVLDDFALSPESQSRSVAFVSGIFVEDPVAAQIARLYDTSFGRLPDVAGLVAWKGAIEGGALTLRQVAGDFVTSPEFQAKYGALSNTDFVKALYVNTLHRTADAPGLAGWTGALAGGLSRGDVVVGFSESAEHVANTASNVMGNTPATYGIHFA